MTYINTFIKRLINFFRPQPRYIKLPIDEILSNPKAKGTVEKFNDFYYTSGNAGDLNWRGDPLIKNPCDLWSYVEIFQEIKPLIIIETGTHRGGSASFYADICQILKIETKIITIDINAKWSFDPNDKNIVSIKGKSTDPQVINQVKSLVQNKLEKKSGNILVLLDSDHSEKNVYEEMLAYADLVTIGSYMIVEDTNVNGHPSFSDHGPGPWEAVEKFMAGRIEEDFKIDMHPQRFMLTFNPNGYLKKIK